MNQKERLKAVFKRSKVDRPPVICPGGMMNAAVVEIMDNSGHFLPMAYSSEDLIADLAVDIYKKTGFENIGLPFCMTVEAEIMGSSVNMGSISCEPKIEKEAYTSVDDVLFPDINSLLNSGRAGSVIGAIRKVSKLNPSVPVIGVVTGPLSLGAAIVEPMTFYKELRKKRVRAHHVFDRLSSLIASFALMMVEAGASAITIADPGASGEILGPALFEEYAVRYLNKIADIIHGKSCPVIVHICGDMKSVKHLIGLIRADAMSMDSMMSLSRFKKEYPFIITMGNVSTQILKSGSEEKIARIAEKLIEDGIDIIAPACGLDTGTSLKSIHALTDSVKGYVP